MSQDDVRLYCLPCSEATGKLVQRTCPAAQSAKDAHKQRNAERKQRLTFAAIQKADKSMWFTCPVTGTRERADVLAAACVHALTGKTKAPDLNLRRSRVRSSTSGRACPKRNHVAVTLGRDCDIAKFREIVLHECTHIAVGDGKDRNRSRADWHGPKFQKFMCDAAKVLWGVTVEPLAHPGAYGPSRALEKALREKFVTGKRGDRI